MKSTIDIAHTPHVQLAGGEFHFVTSSGEIALVSRGAWASVDAALLVADGIVEASANDDWCCLVGVQAPEIIAAAPGDGRIENLGRLERLDLRDEYDPGGLHRLDFKPLEGGDLLIVHEFGAARISRSRGLVWQRAHRDLTARLDEVGGGRVQFAAEGGSFAYDADNGHDI